MAGFVERFLDGVDSFFAWLSAEVKQTTESYCELETADSTDTLVAHDGSLVSIIRIDGVTQLVGAPEFERLHEGISLSLHTVMSRPGYALQVFFGYDDERIGQLLEEILLPAKRTAERLNLKLDDLFRERVEFLSRYCAEESVFFVLWTRPSSLSREQLQRASKDKIKLIRDLKLPPFKNSQNVIAPLTDLRDPHQAFVRSLLNDLTLLGVKAS